MTVLIRGERPRRSLRLTALAVTLCVTSALSTGLAPAPARADDDASTLERSLGVLLGSVDGALIARAATIRQERTPGLALVYAGAIGGGAILGYAVSDHEDALVAMGLVLIPLAVLNWALPPLNQLGGEPHARAAGGHLSGETLAGDVLRRVALGLIPQPARDGVRIRPLVLRF